MAFDVAAITDREPARAGTDDVVVLGNNHQSLGTISPRTISEFISPDGFVFDYWNHYSHLPATELGDSYFAVGRSGKVVERV